jgi:hypothetical protein
MSKASSDDIEVGTFESLNPDERVPFFRLVTTQLSARENAPGRIFHLRFTLGCGEGEIEGTARYSVHLRQCIVEIKTKNCVQDLSNAYSFELPESIIADNTNNDLSEKLKYGIIAGAEGGMSSASSGWRANLLGKVGLKKSMDRSQTRKTSFKRRIMLVACNGAFWQVGDAEHGDPRNERGRLKERYFNETPDRPLCAIEVPEGIEVAEICVEVRAKFGHLDVEVLDDLGRPKRTARQTDALDVSDALKARLRGISIAKALREKQRNNRPGVELPESEFLLSTSTLRAHMPRPRLRGSADKPTVKKNQVCR